MALSRLLESDHDERQKRIIAACLTAHAKDPCIEIRMTVAESIADYNPKDALRVLITLLEDENLGVRECAVSSLKDLNTKAAAAVPTLLRTIPKAEGELREDMLRALGVIKSHPVLVVPFLTDILTHDSDLHRSEAAWALGEFGEDAEPAVRALLSLLKSKDGSARNAAQALGKIGKQPSLVIPALCAFLNRKGSVNLYLKSGIDALAVFGPDAKSALPIIHSILKTALSKSHTQYTVSAALCAIARIAPQDPKTLPLLLGFLKGHHEVIQEGALNGLAFMGSEAADALPVLKKLPKSYKVGNAIRAIEKAIR
jgi:HEAT repeat protein